MSMHKPLTKKVSREGRNDNFFVGSSCMQGWRSHMEDTHTHIISIPNDMTTGFFGVYDGHGGITVSKYLSRYMHEIVWNRPEYYVNIELALMQSFFEADDNLRNERLEGDTVGSTAVVVVIRNNRLYCANTGDSRAIGCYNGVADLLSFDHKPCNALEQKRIELAGGFVASSRVNGNLAISRAFGDFYYKRNYHKSALEQIITVAPDIEKRVITPQYEFIILACDGIWDVMSNDQVLQFCRMRIAAGLYPKEICEQLLDNCVAREYNSEGIGADNMTAILVCFLNNETYEDYSKRVAIACTRKITYVASKRSATSLIPFDLRSGVHRGGNMYK